MEQSLKADFRNMVYLIWKHLNLPDPTPVQYDIAEFLQHGPNRCCIQAFRGVGKSWITSAYVLWVLYCDPQKKILVISASKDRADAFTQFTRRLIQELPVLQHLRAGINQRDSNIAFDVGPAMAAHSPSVKSVGITGQIAGSRADVIVLDDIETPKNSLTQTMRERLSEAIKEADAVLMPKDDSKIIYLGTPQSEMSLYKVLPERGYTTKIWPARVPIDKLKYGDQLADYVINLGLPAGSPVEPSRFDNKDLMKREASYGRAGFALQFMLDTRLSDAERFPLKLGDLIVMDLSTELGPVSLAWGSGYGNVISDLPCVGLDNDHYHAPMFVSKEMFTSYTGSVLAIDPSGQGSDETAYAVVKILHGRLFLLASGGFKDGYSESTLESIALIAKLHKVNYCVVEKNFGGGMFTELLKPRLAKHWNVSVEEVHHTGQKERRICDTLEPLMNQHRLVVDRQLIEKDYRENQEAFSYQLFYQMSRITRDRGALKHDDRLDALSIACSYWIEQLARDEDQAAVDHMEDLRNIELDKFIEHAIGKPSVPLRMF